MGTSLIFQRLDLKTTIHQPKRGNPMNDQPGFQSELRQTYSNQTNQTTTAPKTEPLDPSQPFANANNAEPSAMEQSPQYNQNTVSNYTKHSYPQSTQEENSQTQNTQSAPGWSSERVQFTITNCSFALFLSSIAAAIMLYTKTAKDAEIVAVFLGQAIGGLEIGFATSLVLWHHLKSGRSMTTSLAASNLFTVLANIPIGMAIAACLYYLLSDSSVSAKELLEAPLRVLGIFYWVPVVLIIPAIVCWGAESFLVNRFFATSSATMPTNIGMQPISDLAPTFSVRRANTAARCDICHQDDMFVLKTGFCRRCQKYTF